MKSKLAGIVGKTVLSIILLYACVIILSILFQFIPGDGSFGLLATPIGLGLSAWLMYAWFERKKAWPIGWQDRKGAGNFLLGGSIAAIVVASTVAAMLAVGSVDVHQASWGWSALLFQILLFLSVAVGEEWLFRGYLFGLYKQFIGVRFAVLANSFVFTAIHLINPDAMNRPVEHIAIEMINIFLMAVLMSQARLFTGTLWAPIGLHFLLNFFQSSVFGFKNGGKDVESLFEVSYEQLTIWNGATNGLESSFLFTPILLLAVAVYVWWGQRR